MERLALTRRCPVKFCRKKGKLVDSAQYGDTPEKVVVIVRLVATHCFSWYKQWQHFGCFSYDPGQELGMGWILR